MYYFCHPGFVKPHNYQPPLIINVHLPFVTCIQKYLYLYRKLSSADYTLLYHILATNGWPCVHGTTSVASVVARLSADAMVEAVPCGITN
jgi:hypothetical protein